MGGPAPHTCTTINCPPCSYTTLPQVDAAGCPTCECKPELAFCAPTTCTPCLPGRSLPRRDRKGCTICPRCKPLICPRMLFKCTGCTAGLVPIPQTNARGCPMCPRCGVPAPYTPWSTTATAPGEPVSLPMMPALPAFAPPAPLLAAAGLPVPPAAPLEELPDADAE